MYEKWIGERVRMFLRQPEPDDQRDLGLQQTPSLNGILDLIVFARIINIFTKISSLSDKLSFCHFYKP